MQNEIDKLKNAIELALFHAEGECDCDNIEECNTRIIYVLNQSLKGGENEKTNTKRP